MGELLTSDGLKRVYAFFLLSENLCGKIRHSGLNLIAQSSDE